MATATLSTLYVATTTKTTPTAITYTAANATQDRFTPGDNTCLLVKNGATAATCTPQVAATIYGVAASNPVITIAANSETILGPFTQAEYAQATDGLVYVNWTTPSTVTVALVAP